MTASPARIALRATTTAPALTILAIVIVAATAFVGAAAPGLLQSAQTASVRYTLAAQNPAQLDVTGTIRGAVPPGRGSSPAARALPADLQPIWGSALDELTATAKGFAPALRQVLGTPRVVTTLDGVCSDPCETGDERPYIHMFLSFDPAFADRVKYVEGSAPVEDIDTAPVQIALGAAVAAEMGWKVGEARRLDYESEELSVVLTGTFEPIDAHDPEWQHAPTALTPDVLPGGLGKPTVVGTAYAPASMLRRAVGLVRYASSTAWYPFEIDRVDATQSDAIDAGIRKFSSQPHDLTVVPDPRLFPEGMSYRSSAPVPLAAAGVRIDATAAIVALVASGPAAVAVVVLALAARMIAVRRRASVRLAVARGASWLQIALLLGLEGLAIGIIGAVPAGVAAAWLFGGEGAIVALGPVVAALTPAIALPVLGLAVSRRRGRADLGSTVQASASVTWRRWRLGAEVALAAITAVATVIVATRSRDDTGGAIDPLLTALPLLLAAVGSAAALRLVPVVLSLVERGAAANRGLLALLGPARARRDPAIRVAPVLAVVVGVAIAIFSVGFLATVQNGIRVSSHSTVGADVRVEAGYLAPDQLAAIRDLDGVAAVAPVYASQQTEGDLPAGDIPVTVYVIDVAELRAVQRDPGSRIHLPDALLTTGADRVPVIASTRLAARVGGDTLALDGTEVEIVGTAQTESPFGAAGNWVAVDRANADSLVSNPNSPTAALLDLATGTKAADVMDSIRDIAPAAVVSSPATAAAALLDDPALDGVEGALLAAIGLVAVFLALALAMSLVLGAAARGRLLSLLGALGFRKSGEPGLVVWEVAPAIGIALPIGALLGLALPYLVVGGIDLTTFVGGDGQPEIRLGGWLPLLVAGGCLVLTALCVLIATLAAGRVTAARTLRTIDEEG